MEHDTQTAAPQYDVIIVGAGPAGLSAARTTARLGFSTLVLDRSAEVGLTSHPCNAIIAPVPGLFGGRRLLGDLFYPELDLLIPLSMVVGYPRLHRFVSPDGHCAEAAFARGDGSPVAAIDRGRLLKLMADQAERSGAELRFGVEVSGLIIENDGVTGVHTTAGDLRAPLVLAADGSSRRLSRAAGLYSDGGRTDRRALIVTREVEAPAVRRPHLGQITTFGRRYTSADEAFGTVVMPLPGRASITFTLLSPLADLYRPQVASYYVDEYMREDPRVRDLLAGARTLEESTWTIAIDEGPSTVARRGFLSFGDAATPAGHVGLLPAIYMGRKAALVATEALDMDDVSARRLGMYERLFHNRVARTLRAERDMMLSLVQMPDAEIDRLTEVLGRLPLAAPFFGGWQGMPWEATNWIAQHYPDSLYRTDPVHRILAGEPQQAETFFPGSLWSLPMNSGTLLS